MTTKVPAELSSTPSIVDNGNATAITINSDENVGIGTSTIDTTYSGYVGLELGAQAVINGNRTTGDTGVTSISQNGYLSSASGGSWKYKESGKAALIQGVDDGSIRFYTTDTTGSADDALTWSERARFLSSGGLAFNGDTAAANALDDYEEGTWNPTLIAETGTSGQSYDRQYGYYTRIGDFVFLTFDVRVTNIGTSPSGALLTLGNHGFTFTSNNTGGMGTCGWFNLPNLGTNQVNFYANGSYIYCMEGSTTYIDIANHLTTNSRLIGGFCGQINR